MKDCKTFGELFAEIRKLSESDKKRLMQCIACARNPKECGFDSREKDENGMCKQYLRGGRDHD